MEKNVKWLHHRKMMEYRLFSLYHIPVYKVHSQ